MIWKMQIEIVSLVNTEGDDQKLRHRREGATNSVEYEHAMEVENGI